MKNLFDFSPSAQRLHLIVHTAVKCFVKKYQSDAILDMAEMYNTLANGYPVYMCVRENGFDTIKRYNIFGQLPQSEVTNDEEFEIVRDGARRINDVEVYVKVFPDVARVDVMLVRPFSKSELSDIKNEFSRTLPFEVNFVENFS